MRRSIHKFKSAASILCLAAFPAQAQQTTSYTYDALGRLNGVQQTGGPVTGANVTYTYDAAGNRQTYVSTNPDGFSVAAASANEGSPLSFTVTRGSTSGAATVNYGTKDDTAIAGTNYTATSGTLSFASGVSSASFTVPTIDDGLATSNLNMTVSLTNPSVGASLSNPMATGTIINTDPAPSFSISAATSNEGSPLTFAISRSGSTSSAASVNFATSNGTALAGTNYTSTSGTVNFAAGVSTQNVAVATADDHAYTANLTMTATLSAPSTGTVIGTASASGTIANIDAEPSLTVASASANEGSSLTFTVTRSGATGNVVSVNFATSNGTALAGTNYSSASGTVNFAAGVTTQNVTVATTDDHVYTASLTMNATLSAPSSGATIGTANATGTIANIDAQPSLAVANASANEGSPLTFTVIRSGATGNAVAVGYATSNGTAAAGTNYTATTGTLSFAAGVTSQAITVPTIDDHVITSNLSMNLGLSSPTGSAVLGTANATGTIVNIESAWSSTLTSSSYSVCGKNGNCRNYNGYSDTSWVNGVAMGSMSNTTYSSYKVDGIFYGYLYSQNTGATTNQQITLNMSGSSAPANSGWTTISIPGVGNLSRSAATYTTSGTQSSWSWAGTTAVTSGTVTIQ